jgi:RNA polymerase sigma-70 factor, ECF subfamily
MPSIQSSSRPSPPAFASLEDTVRAHLGTHLRQLYSEMVQANLPQDLTRLVLRLESVIQANTEQPDPAFMNDLLNLVPNLRAFAMSLTRNRDWAEDLVQDTILRAWDKRDGIVNLTA